MYPTTKYVWKIKLSVNPFFGIALKDEGKKSIYLCKYLTKFMYIKS